MKKFIFKTILFFIPIVVGFMIFLWKYADGYLDPFYLRTTSQKQSSFIIGSSRAAQGILPQVLNENLDQNKFEGPFYNFAFTIAHSPYGPYYLNAIKRKLKSETSNGIFIVTVEPWSLMEKINPNGSIYEERNLPPGNMFMLNLNPNLEYIIRNYKKPFRKMMVRDDLTTFLHDDGWLEITVPMEESKIKKRVIRKVKAYNKMLKEHKPSDSRVEYLNETIDFLKSKGTVFLVRIPCSNEIRTIEDKFWSDFNKEMKNISLKKNVKYFDFSRNENNYRMVDGNHLYKKDAIKFSQQLTDSLNKLLK